MKKTFKLVTVVIVALVLFVGSQCFYVVEPHQYANTVRFSKTVSTQDESGMYLKLPFIDTIKYFPKQVLLYDMQPSDVLTVDSETMQVDNYVTWRITDPLKFYKTLGNTTEAETRINMLIYSAIKTEMGQMKQSDIISADESSRDKFNTNVIESVSDTAQTYGIEIVDVKIKKLDLPAENEQAVYNRMISERSKIAAQYRADGEREATTIKSAVDMNAGVLVSDAKAEAENIKAEGESEYLRILAETYNTPEKKEFYEFTRSLDALEASLNNDTTIILGSDSVIAKALMTP